MTSGSGNRNDCSDPPCAPHGNLPLYNQASPGPAGNAREVVLPTNVVVDMTTWGTTSERSQLGVNLNHFTGYADILVNPNGTVVPTTIYSVPSVVGMSGSFTHLWLAERSDVNAPLGAERADRRPGRRPTCRSGSSSRSCLRKAL